MRVVWEPEDIKAGLRVRRTRGDERVQAQGEYIVLSMNFNDGRGDVYGLCHLSTGTLYLGSSYDGDRELRPGMNVLELVKRLNDTYMEPSTS